MLPFLDENIVFFGKHHDHIKALASSSDSWFPVAFAGEKQCRETEYCYGAGPSESSKPFFNDLESTGIPLSIQFPFSIWSAEPYQWLYSLGITNQIKIYASDYYIFSSISDKFGLFSELLRFGQDRIASFLRNQMDMFAYEYFWSPYTNSTGELRSASTGEGGQSHQISTKDPRRGVFLGSKFCDYEIGLIKQSIVFRDGVILGPTGRTWSGQVNNIFRNSCIYYPADFEALGANDELNLLQLEIGQYLRSRGFRGAFSTDWLLEADSGHLFLLEVNPRFSSDLCLFDRRLDEGLGILPLGYLHLIATAGLRASEISLRPGTELSFIQAGGGLNRAYYPPDGTEIDVKLQYSRFPRAEFDDRHTNAPLLEALK